LKLITNKYLKMTDQNNVEMRDNSLKEIDNIRFPIINIRRTSNLAVAPINTFGLAMGIFMLSLPLTDWCEFRSPSLATALVFGGLCQYIIGIYDWYQGKTFLSFVDFIFGLLHLLIYYSFRLCEYDLTPVSGNFESYLIGTFFVLYLVILLILLVISKSKGIFHLVNIALLILADIMIIVWQYRYKDLYEKESKAKHIKKVKKAAGYFLFFASLTIWFTGVGKLINEVFQKNLIPFIDQ